MGRLKEDQRAYLREWKRAHRDRVNAQARLRYRERPPTATRRAYLRAFNHAYYLKHRETLLPKKRAYAAQRRAAGSKGWPEDSVAKRTRRRRYRLAHYETEMAQGRAWKAAHPGYRPPPHPERRRAQARAYYAAHREEVLVRGRRYRKANPNRMKALRARRRIHETTAPVVELVDRLAIYCRDGGVCYLCHRRVSLKTFTLDHLVPLSRGGEHAAFNVAVVHHRCNSRKHAKRIPIQVPLPLAMPPSSR